MKKYIVPVLVIVITLCLFNAYGTDKIQANKIGEINSKIVENILNLDISMIKPLKGELNGCELNSTFIDDKKAILVTAYREKIPLVKNEIKEFKVEIPIEEINKNNIERIYYGTEKNFKCIWEVKDEY